MCYRKPGGRCSPHAIARRETRQKFYDRARERAEAHPNNKQYQSAFQKQKAALTGANRAFILSPAGRLVLADRYMTAESQEQRNRVLEQHGKISRVLERVRAEDSEERRDRYGALKLQRRGPMRKRTSVERAIGFDGEKSQEEIYIRGTTEEKHALANSSLASNKSLEVLTTSVNREIALRAWRHLNARTVKFVPHKG